MLCFLNVILDPLCSLKSNAEEPFVSSLVSVLCVLDKGHFGKYAEASLEASSIFSGHTFDMQFRTK
jgi:hypothetical protein